MGISDYRLGYFSALPRRVTRTQSASRCARIGLSLAAKRRAKDLFSREPFEENDARIERGRRDVVAPKAVRIEKAVRSKPICKMSLSLNESAAYCGGCCAEIDRGIAAARANCDRLSIANGFVGARYCACEEFHRSPMTVSAKHGSQNNAQKTKPGRRAGLS